jgi:hypothetical protein
MWALDDDEDEDDVKTLPWTLPVRDVLRYTARDFED